jgi:hypothetical protein
LIAKRFLILIQSVEMARIVPPFCFEFRMGEMISRKGENSSRKGPLEVLGEEIAISNKIDGEDYQKSDSCHSEERSDEESNIRRFFTEFTLSRKPRPFALLRVTHGEGFRMTITSLMFEVALESCAPKRNEGSSSRTILHSNPPTLDSQTRSILFSSFSTILLSVSLL